MSHVQIVINIQNKKTANKLDKMFETKRTATTTNKNNKPATTKKTKGLLNIFISAVV